MNEKDLRMGLSRVLLLHVLLSESQIQLVNTRANRMSSSI